MKKIAKRIDKLYKKTKYKNISKHLGWNQLKGLSKEIIIKYKCIN